MVHQGHSKLIKGLNNTYNKKKNIKNQKKQKQKQENHITNPKKQI